MRIPLAIELAASWTKVLTPADAVAAREADQLAGTGTARRATAHWRRVKRQLAEAIAGPDQLLARLSVFRGGWTVEEAEDVCDVPFPLLPLTELHDASLILSKRAPSRCDIVCWSRCANMRRRDL